jgi:peptide/nickel transport system substrate-binding protein
MQPSRPSRGLSRRRFLILSTAGVGLGAGLLAACAPAAPSAPTPAAKVAVPTPVVNVAVPTAAATVAPAAKPTAAPAAPAAQATTAPAATVAQTPMVIAEDLEPPTMDPQFYEGGALRSFLNNAMVKLLSYDGEMVLRPEIAESYQLQPDKLTWRFKLRPNLKFWNGEPLDAEAVKFTFDRTMNQELRKQGLNSPFPARIGLAETKVIDKTTVDVITKVPNILTPIWVQAETILAPGHYSSKSIQETATQPMGAGPWRLVEWQKGSQYVLEANTDYFRGRPPVDKIIVRYIPDRTTRIALLQRGEADLAATLLPDDMPVLAGDSKLEMRPSAGGWRVHMQVPTYKYTDKRVRQAFNHLVNYEALDKGLLSGILGPGARMLSPAAGPTWHAPDLKPYPYDPERAKQLLKEANFPMDQEITLYGSVGGRMRDKDVVQALAAEFKKAGLNAKAEIVEVAVYSVNQRKDEYKDINFRGLGTRWHGPEDMGIVLPDSGFDSTQWTEKTEGGKKYMEVYSKLTQEFDEEKQRPLVHEVERLHYDESPWMYLWLEPRLYGVNKRITWKPTGIGQLELWPNGGESVKLLS